MANKIIQILRQHGSMLSGEMAKILEVKFNMTNTAARQAISRASSPVHKLKKISFERNQSFLYLEDKYNSKQYKTELLSAIKESSKTYYSIILIIQNNGGYISKKILPSFTSIPIGNIVRHKRFDVIIADLISCGIICALNEDYYQLNVMFFPGFKFSLNRTKAIELTKKTVIDDFYTWARNVNFVSYNSGKTIYEQGEFCKLQWCFTAPTYLSDLKDRKTEKAGFIVADVLLGTRGDLEDIEFFINKINIAKSFKKTPNFIPVLITDNLTKSALSKLKQYGVLCAVISNFFDAQYDKLLKELLNLITNSTAIFQNNPEKLSEYVDKISKIEGKLGNLIGDLFELSVAFYYKKRGCEYLDTNKIINFQGQQKEIDVFVIREGKCIIVECKGLRNKLDDSYVKKWISENVPIIYKWANERYPEFQIEFELWCTGGFSELGLEKLSKAKETTKKYAINFWEKEKIVCFAKQYKCNVLEKCIEQYIQNDIS